MAGESVLGELWIAIRANMKDLDKDLKTAKGRAESVLGGIGTAVGGVAIAGIAALGAAVAGVGAAAYAAGMKFDGAYDTILIKTGETGSALEGLKGDFNEVFKSVPTDAALAAEALSVLHDRTGLVGSGLQEMTKQMLELARITEGDAVVTSENFTRVLGDWSIATEDASVTADMFFVASQNAGVGVDDLMTKVVQFGSPLRLMGYSLKQAISMFAKWEKEGVNSELVMGSLRIAAGKFADAGRPLQESLAKTIESIKNNEDATAALAEGMDVFGARAGPDMVAAIREGRFGIDEFVASLDGAKGAIMDAATATMDFPEKLQLAKQKLETYLAPIGLMFMDTALVIIDKLQPALDRLGPFIQDVVAPAFEVLAGAIVKVADGDLEGALADLFGKDPGALTSGLSTGIGAIGSTIGGMLIDAVRGVFGLESTVDDTATELEKLLRKAANKAGQAAPEIGRALARGVVEGILTGLAPKQPEKAAEVAETMFPTKPQPFGQGLELSSRIISEKVDRLFGNDAAANREIAGYIAAMQNIYKDANEEAKKGFVIQLASMIDNNKTSWEIAGNLNAITDPELKQAVADYLVNYASEEVFPIVAEALTTGVTGEVGAAYSDFGNTDGKTYASAFSDGVLAEMRASGVLGSVLGEITDSAGESGTNSAIAWQGGFSAQFGGWQPPQLLINPITGQMPMPQSIATPTGSSKIVTIGTVNFFGVKEDFGWTLVNQLRRDGAW